MKSQRTPNVAESPQTESAAASHGVQVSNAQVQAHASAQQATSEAGFLGGTHPALAQNERMPDGPSVVMQLARVFSIPDAFRGFTDANCAWIERAQSVLGISVATPGVLDDRTLLHLEQHVRAPATWADKQLVRAEFITDPEAMGTDSSGRWAGDTFDVGVDASALIAPESMDGAALFEFYQPILQMRDDSWEPGQRAVLAIRGLDRMAEAEDTTQQTRLGWDMMAKEQYYSTTSPTERSDQRRAGEAPVLESGYRDTFVVMKPDLTAERFSGGTVPTTVRSPKRRDGNAAMLQPGAYRMEAETYFGGDHRSWEVRTDAGSDRVPVWRNRASEGDAERQNLDGGGSFAERNTGLTDFWMSGTDRERSRTGGDIKFHRGAADAAGGIGCMTFPDAEFEGFMEASGQSLEGDVEATSQDFVLIDAREFLLDNPDYAARNGGGSTSFADQGAFDPIEAIGPTMPELELPDLSTSL